MLRFAPAKINIGLYITGQRADGYHTIETCLVPIPLCDIIEITQPEGLVEDALYIKGLPIKGAAASNSILKVLQELRSRGCEVPPLRIELVKRIPSEAGLGGGSSDAAVALRAVNDLLHLRLTKEELASVAAVAGADTPFFIYDGPMLATGIGTDLEPVELPEELRCSYVVVVKPPLAISTKEAYALVANDSSSKGYLKRVWSRAECFTCTRLVNQFEAVLFPRYPQLANLKQTLIDKGAYYASLSGSGSAVYGLFKEKTQMGIESLPQGTFLWQGSFNETFHSIPL